MLTYRITVFFYGGEQHSWNPPGQDLPEGQWVKGDHTGRDKTAYRDPHGFLEAFAATEIGAFLIERLRPPFAVQCEVEEAAP